MNAYRFSFFFLIFFLSLTTTRILASQNVFAPGEQLEYKAYYHFGFVWIAAASIKLSVLPNDDSRYLTFQAVGKSFRRYDPFFKVRENYTSTVEANTLAPVSATREAIEGTFQVSDHCQFNPDSGVVNYRIIRNSGGNSIGKEKIKGKYFDILTSAYYFRTFDFSKMAVGDYFVVNTFVDGKFYPITIEYLGNEMCSDNNDHAYFCAKFKVSTIKGKVFSGKEDILMWVTNDAAKIPIRVTSKILVGEVNVVLISAKGIK
jgi:hypothetical protein